MKQRGKYLLLILALVVIAALAGFALGRKKGISESATQTGTGSTSTAISQTVLPTATPSSKPEEKPAADISKEDAAEDGTDASNEDESAAEDGSSAESEPAAENEPGKDDEPATESESGKDDESATESESGKNDEPATAEEPAAEIDEYGEYTSKEEVALYLHTYGRLPSNYITKKEAEKLGWDSREGNLWEVAPGKSIGGSKFGNREGNLPSGSYKECDINYEGGYRGPERIVYSDDGRIYYTADHYNTFEQLY